jgi:hypothetical protein
MEHPSTSKRTDGRRGVLPEEIQGSANAAAFMAEMPLRYIDSGCRTLVGAATMSASKLAGRFSFGRVRLSGADRGRLKPIGADMNRYDGY